MAGTRDPTEAIHDLICERMGVIATLRDVFPGLQSNINHLMRRLDELVQGFKGLIGHV